MYVYKQKLTDHGLEALDYKAAARQRRGRKVHHLTLTSNQEASNHVSFMFNNIHYQSNSINAKYIDYQSIIYKSFLPSFDVLDIRT